MAVILPIFLVLLAVPLFLGRIFWFYSVGQKAAHDAARYLATASQADIRTLGTGSGEADVARTAAWIADQEVASIRPFTDGILIDVDCNASTCGAVVPSSVRVGVQIILHDSILNDITSYYLGNTRTVLVGDVTMRYVGE